MVPVRYVRGKGGLAEKVQGKFRLRKELVPQEVGDGIGYTGKYGKEVGFEGVDGAFIYVAAMNIRRDKLENAVPIFKDGTTTLVTGLVFMDLEVDAVAFVLETRNHAVVVSNYMAVVA